MGFNSGFKGLITKNSNNSRVLFSCLTTVSNQSDASEIRHNLAVFLSNWLAFFFLSLAWAEWIELEVLRTELQIAAWTSVQTVCLLWRLSRLHHSETQKKKKSLGPFPSLSSLRYHQNVSSVFLLYLCTLQGTECAWERERERESSG